MSDIEQVKGDYITIYMDVEDYVMLWLKPPWWLS